MDIEINAPSELKDLSPEDLYGYAEALPFTLEADQMSEDWRERLLSGVFYANDVAKDQAGIDSPMTGEQWKDAVLQIVFS